MDFPAASRLARAKLNLWLHVGRAAPDGYHPIHSLMVFADLGDTVRLRWGASRALEVNGPFADRLGDDNLVESARSRLEAAFPLARRDFGLALEKRLPIAAGLGGGSADAAATLKLMRDALGLAVSDEDLARLGLSLGSDVPACLTGCSVIARGRGERLSPAPPMPAVDVVLVNPGAPSRTTSVYDAFDESGAPLGATAPVWPGRIADGTALASFLRESRNDLEAPAVRLTPAIGEVLRVLTAQPETLLARMSGSGATCFALCKERSAAIELAARLVCGHPRWWIRHCRLGGG